MVAGLLLMYMEEEAAFWSLAALLDNHLRGYFDRDLSQVHLDTAVLHRLVAEYLPRLSEHMASLAVHPLSYAVAWLMAVFTSTLPWPTVLRVWDAFVYEGIKVLFRAALALLVLAEPHLLTLTNGGEVAAALSKPTAFLDLSATNFMSTLWTVKVPPAVLATHQAAVLSLKREHGDDFWDEVLQTGSGPME